MKNKIFTGTGMIDPKTLEEAINKNENIVVVDSSEIYLRKHYNKLKEKGYNIKILNLKSHDQSDLFNVLEYPYFLYKNGKESQAIDLVTEISNIITYSNDVSDPFWTTTAAGLISGTIIELFNDAKEDEINLMSVYKMIATMHGSFDMLTTYFKLKKENAPSRTLASTSINAPVDTKLSIAAVASAKSGIFVNDFYNAPINLCNVKIKDFEKKKQALFIINNTKSKATMISILLNEILYNQKFDNPKCTILISNLNAIDYIINLDEFLQTSTYNNVSLLVNIGSKKLFKEKYNINSLENLDVLETTHITSVKGNVVFPKNKNNFDIKWFDLEKYFKDHNIVNEKRTELDDIIEKLAKEIEEIEKEEEQNSKK